MDDEPSKRCPCDVCNGTHKSKPKDVASILRTSARTAPPQRPVNSVIGAPRGRPSRGRGRPSSLRGKLPTYQGPRDDDGLPDFLIRWLTLLKREGRIERDFREIPSLEHQLENTILGETAKRLGKYPPFAPRVGELVLFYRNYDGELKRDPQNGHVKIYDTRTQLFKGYPKWLGGIVTQIPVDEEPVLLEDIEGKAPKKLGVSSSGFRVECLPDVNSEDKSLTKQYTHVPLMHIRPMIYWQDYIPNEQRLKEAHPSVSNVLAANRTISLIGKHKLLGMWPDAHIFAKGLFLGSECHYTGDVVRLFPEDDDGEKVIKVMEIHAFILSMVNLEAEPHNGTTVTGNRCDHITIKARGKVYQRDPPYPSAEPIDPSTLPKVMHPFSPWYYPSSTTTSSAASSSEYHSIEAVRILSRLPSFASTQIYTSPSTIYPTAALSKGYRSVCDARVYSLHHDGRLDSPDPKKEEEEEDLDNAGASSSRSRKGGEGEGKTWFLAETRAEALDIESFNGVEVGTLQDRDRDLARMQRIYEVLKEAKDNDSNHVDEKLRSTSTPSNVGIAPMVVLPPSSSTMMRAAGGMPSVVIDKGKGKAIDLLTSDEDEKSQQDDDDSDEQHPTFLGNERDRDQDIDMLGVHSSHLPTRGAAPSASVKPSSMVLASNTATGATAAASSVEIISSDDDDDDDNDHEEQDKYGNGQGLQRAGRRNTMEESREKEVGDMERDAKRMKL